MAAPVRPQSYRSVPSRAPSIRSVPSRSATARPATARPATARLATARPATARPATARPVLRVIEGGRGVRTPARFHLRRAAAVLCCALAVVLGLRGAALGVSALAAPSATATDGAVAETVHVARAGDTLWGVATRYAPGVDPRVAIDDLIALNGGASLQVGQRILLPADWF